MAFRIPSATGAIYKADPQVVAAVRNASTTTGTNFDTLLASAAMESGLNPSAKASTSSASGLFQFTQQTWLSTVRQYGGAHGLSAEASSIISQDGVLTVADPSQRQRILNLRSDPTLSAAMAGEHLRSLASTMTTSLGHQPDAAETYLGHFLGSAGATQMLRAAQATPNRPAADVLPEAAAANSSIFNTNGSPKTAAQFVQDIRGRVAQAFNEVGSTMPQGALAFEAARATGGDSTANGGGAFGRGVGLARASATPAERAMSATLVDVFTRLDQGSNASRTSHAKRDHNLPLGLVSALASAENGGPGSAPAQA